MRKGIRTGAIVAAATAVATAATIGLVAPSATAGTDPVTGGTSLIDLNLSSVAGFAALGVVSYPTTPATVTYDPTRSVVEYSLPVTGGDGSIANFYGDVRHTGNVVLVNGRNGKSVTLGAFDFTIQNDTISATPSGSSAVVLFDAGGIHDFYGAGQPETFSASELKIDPAGAAYLDKALDTKAFKAGQAVGSFSTSFTNSNDG